MSLFSYIKSHVSILDVAQQYATLKRAGLYWKGNCPFHHEKTASFTVSPHKEIFYCFGCHAGGDVIAFMAKAEHCSQIEAAYHLVDRYNLEIPLSLKPHEGTETVDHKQRYFVLSKQVALWAHEQLFRSTNCVQYLTSRGFAKESFGYFILGYFPSGQAAIKNLLHYVQKNNFLANDLIDAGILAHSKAGFYSPFEERIIFPIKDPFGRFCGFGGRIYKLTDERPKYYNSKENSHFIKGSLLFGLDLAKESIQKTDTVFVVEGYTDCVAMVEYGYKNTVATLGTACTVQHLKMLSRYAQHLYVLFDSDNAGQQAIIRLTQLCWQVNMELKVIILPTKEDPASFLKKKGDLETLINNAVDIFYFFIASVSKNFSTCPLHEKVDLLRTILETIEPINEPLKQDILLQKVSKMCDIPFDSLKKELHQLKIKSFHKEQNLSPAVSTPNIDLDISVLEKRVFCGIIQNTASLNNSSIQQIVEYMPDKLRSLLHKVRALSESQRSDDFVHFFDTLEESEKLYISRLLIELEGPITIEILEQLVLQLQKKQWKAIVHDIRTKIAHAKQANNEQEVDRLVKDFLNLKQKLMLSPSSDTKVII